MTAAVDLSPKRKAFLHGIFTTALEGGIGYWSECSKYHWRKPGEYANFNDSCDLDGFYAVIHPNDPDGWGFFPDGEDDQSLRVDLELVHRGVSLFRDYLCGNIDFRGQPIALEDRKPVHPNHYWRQFIEADISSGDDGDYDAEVADQIVQFGLFGQVVYA